MWDGFDKGGKTNKTLNFNGTGLRVLPLIRFMMMMMTTAIYTALIVYNFHFMTNFRNCDFFFLVRWRFLKTRETIFSCNNLIDKASM